jgi:hypothetical protein
LFRRIWAVFNQMFVFAVVGFSKCKSLYLNEREKCYERQIYAFNPHKLVKKCRTPRRNICTLQEMLL